MKPFELAIEEHGPAIYRFCLGRVGPDRAEDCFQETMLAALKAYDEVRDERALRSWLFTIASRKVVDFYRASDRIPVPTEATDQVVNGPSTGQPGQSDIWQLVDQLPEKQRAAIHLRYRGDLTHREVGKVMGISESAARRNTFEGLKQLRAERQTWS